MSQKYAPDQIVIVPRWSGTQDSDWYPWLRKQVDMRIQVAELDVPSAPMIDGCVASIQKTVGADHKKTLFIGHSVGCQAVLHYLKTQSDPCWGVLLVAGWWDVDKPWDTLKPWIERAPGEPIAPPLKGLHVLLSDNDPFTSDHESNAGRWQAFGAQTRTLPGRAHFNTAQSQDVLEMLDRF